MNDIMDLHTHTIASGHAYSTLSEVIRAAAANGVEIIGISDHGPSMSGVCHESYFSNFKVIPRNFLGMRVMMGCELNILDYEGHVDLKESRLQQLDYTIASLHIPCCKPGTALQNTNAYLGAMKNPYVHIIGHPDDVRYPVDYDTLVAAAKEHHKLLEVNSSSLHPRSTRKGAYEHYLQMLELCKHYQVSVIIGSDAHWESDVGNHAKALALLKEAQFPEELVVNTSIEKLTPYIPSIQNFQEA